MDDTARRQSAVGDLVVERRQADLLEAVLALNACGGLADLLHRGQKQRDQDADDRDDNQQLDEGERAAGQVLHGDVYGSVSRLRTN